MIAWRPGEDGWSTLNTDGSRYAHSCSTAIGGLIRDGSGRFVQVFTTNVGDCSITRAELSAIVQGLKLAWAIGLRKIVVQSDPRTAISILHSAYINHQHAILVGDFQELKSRNWDISGVHVFSGSQLWG
ncbi:Putative ribonuclease H protein At1g65750 [Linum perenne]